MNNEFKFLEQEFKDKYPNLYKDAITDKDKKILLSYYNLAKHSFSKINVEILKTAFEISKEIEPKNLNDFYFTLFVSAKSSGFTKKAYPQSPLLASDNYDNEFDLNKWANLVYKIYDAVLSKDMELESAINYYSNTLNKAKNEDFKFKQWISFYLDGENKKYAKEDFDMKKRSDFQFGLNGSSFYYPDSIPIPEKEAPAPKFEENMDKAEKKQKFLDWKSKLDGAIRRIDKLIRNSDIDVEVSEGLFNSLHDFNMQVHKLKSQVIASDMTFRLANNFKKVGFQEGHDILIKTAQEVDSPIPMPDEQSIAPETKQEQKVQSDDPIKRVYENTSGAKSGEYEQLSQEIDLNDAISKLEEIAARLSDRRVIRLLAEFDIMLDKIGIATMFPEIVESQSKLIDGYSYALVRVTKMLGMLSSGKNLGEMTESRKTNLTNSIRKEVDKSLNPQEQEKKSEPIKEEFQEAPELTKPEAPPSPQAPTSKIE